MRFRFVCAAVPTLVGLFAVLPATAQNVPSSAFQAMDFRHIGPVGNRVTSVAGVPGDPLTYYAGAASGGLWKTEDGGVNWRPVFDDQPVHAIGEVEVSASDPNLVWVGTGEPFIRSNVSIGNGVWKSVDAGETWTHMGLEGTGRISRIIVHPTNPDVVYAAAIGHGYAPQRARGIFRTMDGGETWEHVLFVDDETGASDLVMDPANPRTLFTGTWQIAIRTWTRKSGGPGSAVHVSRDGGTTWMRMEGNGLPEREIGKIALCMSADDPGRVYALIETGDGVPWEGGDTDGGELWRSDDGGRSWSLTSYNRDLAGRTAYYTRCEVNPDDADEAYFLAAAYSTTLDGGVTSTAAPFLQGPVWDHHDMWIDPGDGDRQIVAGDGGLAISRNRGETWYRVQLPIAQMYHVTVDNAIPYNVMGNRQDGPSTRGPSNSRTGGLFLSGIPRGMWHTVGGGESGFATPDPTNHNIVWSSASGAGGGGGIVSRWDARTRQYREVEVWPESTIGHPADSLRYRFQWTFPLLISPHDPNTVYVTSQHVHRTTNRGQSWEVISPDLSTNNRERMGISGGLTPDNIGVEYCCVIYAFDESPLEPGVLWAGTNDGLVHVSRDGGESWINVTANIPDLLPDGVVRGIDASRHATGKAYMVIEHHQVGNFEARAYRTEDYGESWTRITNGIDDGVLSYTRSIHEDPVRPGLLYLGTEASLYVSFDDGEQWQSLHTHNLPHTPMYGLVVQEHFNDLVVGTYGRGFWILDDVTPLQQLTPEVAARPVHLFEPRAAYRFRPVSEPFTMFDDQSDGENPPYGASINYWLGGETEDSVKVEVSNASGEVVRTLEGTGEAGVNRVWWNLAGESATEVRLRTKPLFAEDIDLGDERWRPLPSVLGGPGGTATVLQPPGVYTLTLKVGDETFRQTLEVRKDPHSEGTLGDIRAQLAMLADIRADYETAAALVNRVEWVRRQLLDVKAVLEDRDDASAAALVAAADSLNERFVAAEQGLFQMRATGTGQDGIRYPTRLLERLTYLFNTVAVGDFRPTDSQGEVHAVLKERLERIRVALEALLENDLAEFNRRIQTLGMGVVS